MENSPREFVLGLYPKAKCIFRKMGGVGQKNRRLGTFCVYLYSKDFSGQSPVPVSTEEYAWQDMKEFILRRFAERLAA